MAILKTINKVVYLQLH